MKKRAVAYVRRSSYKQQENNSVEIQTQHIKEFAHRNNMILSDELIFIEDVTSAFNKSANRRRELMRLGEKMVELNITTIIFYDISRIDRTGYSFVLDFYLPLLQEVPALEVYTTNSSKPLDPESPEVKLNFLVANIESEMKSERAIGSLRNDLENNEKIRPGSTTPYGYTQIEKKLCPNSDAEVVSFIFFLYGWGHSLLKISSLLNKAQIPSPKGKVWKPSTIEKIIKNPVYTGNLIWHIHKFKEGKKRYFFEDSHPAIVDEFSIQLHQLNKKLQQQYGRLDTPFLFLNKTRCDQCHQVLSTQNGSTTRNGVKYLYQYYVCKTCKYKVDAQEVHQAFLPLILKRVHSLVSQDRIKQQTLGFLARMTNRLHDLIKDEETKIDTFQHHKKVSQELEDRELELRIEELIHFHQQSLKDQHHCLKQVMQLFKAVESNYFFSRFQNIVQYDLGEIEKRLIILYFVDCIVLSAENTTNIHYKTNVFDELSNLSS